MNKHECHWIGCKKEVPPSMWGCKKHWFALPKRIQVLILKTYRKGQEITKTPSIEYMTAALMAKAWIANEQDKVNGTETALPIIATLKKLEIERGRK